MTRRTPASLRRRRWRSSPCSDGSEVSRALERLEEGTVGLKLGIIVGLLVGLIAFSAERLNRGDGLYFATTDHLGWNSIAVAMGLLVTVQGFETSRYLGEEYDAETRIRTMRYSQWISSAIYLVYIALTTFCFSDSQVGDHETAIVGMTQLVAPVLPTMLVAAALAAQFSAAVADTAGCGGLAEEVTRHRISPKATYLLIGYLWRDVDVDRRHLFDHCLSFTGICRLLRDSMLDCRYFLGSVEQTPQIASCRLHCPGADRCNGRCFRTLLRSKCVKSLGAPAVSQTVVRSDSQESTLFAQVLGTPHGLRHKSGPMLHITQRIAHRSLASDMCGLMDELFDGRWFWQALSQRPHFFTQLR